MRDYFPKGLFKKPMAELGTYGTQYIVKCCKNHEIWQNLKLSLQVFVLEHFKQETPPI